MSALDEFLGRIAASEAGDERFLNTLEANRTGRSVASTARMNNRQFERMMAQRAAQAAANPIAQAGQAVQLAPMQGPARAAGTAARQAASPIVSNVNLIPLGPAPGNALVPTGNLPVPTGNLPSPYGGPVPNPVPPGPQLALPAGGQTAIGTGSGSQLAAEIPQAARALPRGAAVQAAGLSDDVARVAPTLFDDLAGAAGGGGNFASRFGAMGGVRGALGRASLPAMAGLAAGQINSAVWDDTNSTADEGVTGALTGAGIGGGIGAAIGAPFFGVGAVPAGAVGAGIGALIGGGIGLFGSKDTGEKAVQSEWGKQQAKLESVLGNYGLSRSAQQELMQSIGLQVELGAGSKSDVKAIFQQASANIPAFLQQDKLEREARMAESVQNAKGAAIQAAIMPLLEKSSKDYLASSQRSYDENMAAASGLPPELQAMVRARAQEGLTSAQGYNTASIGQIASAQALQSLTGYTPDPGESFSQTLVNLQTQQQQRLAALSGQ